jgi:peptidoglycan/LPS O-acetylase OafA/YrhL
MGTLRTLLALSVMLAHLHWPLLVGGQVAVQLFYVISGFLISYVLLERRTYLRKRTFWLNRLLRLYPIYAVVAVASLVLVVGARSRGWHLEFLNVYGQAPPAAAGLLAVTNVTLLGQDWWWFLGVRDQHLALFADFRASEVALWKGLVVQQAWTLGLELTFYGLAPFVLGRTRLTVALLAGALGVRLWLFHIGLGTSDPWSYRFFPAEVALFLAGSLAHQHLYPLVCGWPERWLGPLATLATAMLLFAIVAYPWLPGPEPLWRLALLLVAVVAVPLTFAFQARHAWDRRVGELSYPLYICHMLVIKGVGAMAPGLGMLGRASFTAVCLVASLAVAWALARLVAAPVERFRERFKAHPSRA